MELVPISASKWFLEEGLLGYEKRFEWEEIPTPIRKFSIPKQWHPGVDPQSKVMLWWEQGIGRPNPFLVSTATLSKRISKFDPRTKRENI